MAQDRFWNWMDDDSTFRMNWRDLIIVPHGRYAGFFGKLSSNMNLILTHKRGSEYATKVKQDLNITKPMGVWKTKQGVIVTEDDDITLRIDTGHPTAGRYDLIVGEHEYVETTGGATASYKVIKGTPADNPLPPLLENRGKQTVLGVLYIPPATTRLDAPDVSYVEADIPNFGNSSTIMHTDKEQHSTALKIFDNQRGKIVLTTIDTDTHKIKIPEQSNFYIIEDLEGTFDGVEEVVDFDTNLSGNGHLVHIYTKHPLAIKNSWNNGGRFIAKEDVIYIHANSYFSVLDVTDSFTSQNRFVILSGGEANTTSANKFNELQIFNKAKEVANISQFNGINHISLPTNNGGNFIEVTHDSSTFVTAGMMSSLFNRNKTETSLDSEAGGFVFLKFNKHVRLEHNRMPKNGSYKPIWLPTEKEELIREGSLAIMIEDNDFWRLLLVTNKDLSELHLSVPKPLEDLANVEVDYDDYDVPNGEMLMGSDGTWKNIPFVDAIAVSNPKMITTIEEGATIFKNSSNTPLSNIGNGTIGLKLNSTLGNLFFFDYPEATNFQIEAISNDYQVGTMLRFVFKKGVVRIVTHMLSQQTNGYLPIHRAGYPEGEVHNFRGRNATLVRLPDYWLWIDDPVQSDWSENDVKDPSHIKNKPTLLGANRFGFDFENNRIELKKGSELLDTVYPFEAFRVTSGHGLTFNRLTHSVSTPVPPHQIADDWEHNSMIVRPPTGFDINDLAGFIASPREIQFGGEVNYDDRLFCKWRKNYAKNQVDVICNNSENSGNASVNFLAIWIKNKL